MNDIEWNKDDFEKELASFLCKYFGVGNFEPSTPMHEIRARLELIGGLLGRTIAVCRHEGPISADIAMAIRAREQEYKERCLKSAGTTFGPGGQVREIWNRTD